MERFRDRVQRKESIFMKENGSRASTTERGTLDLRKEPIRATSTMVNLTASGPFPMIHYPIKALSTPAAQQDQLMSLIKREKNSRQFFNKMSHYEGYFIIVTEINSKVL